MRNCIPPEIQAQAEEAEKRREEAIDRLLSKTGGAEGTQDPFERELVALIDADRNVVRMLQRKTR